MKYDYKQIALLFVTENEAKEELYSIVGELRHKEDFDKFLINKTTPIKKRGENYTQAVLKNVGKRRRKEILEAVQEIVDYINEHVGAKTCFKLDKNMNYMATGNYMDLLEDIMSYIHVNLEYLEKKEDIIDNFYADKKLEIEGFEDLTEEKLLMFFGIMKDEYKHLDRRVEFYGSTYKKQVEEIKSDIEKMNDIKVEIETEDGALPVYFKVESLKNALINNYIPHLEKHLHNVLKPESWDEVSEVLNYIGILTLVKHRVKYGA